MLSLPMNNPSNTPPVTEAPGWTVMLMPFSPPVPKPSPPGLKMVPLQVTEVVPTHCASAGALKNAALKQKAASRHAATVTHAQAGGPPARRSEQTNDTDTSAPCPGNTRSRAD
ncbi:MAG: hypothetical protein M5U33_07880 [Pseudorhodoplanes sp.]|nr:hypothetical protein [Pseudorhodoplanes sp.]